MFKHLAVASLALACAACSTTVRETAALGRPDPSLTIGRINGSGPADLVYEFRSALRQRLAENYADGPPANLDFRIEKYRDASQLERDLIGAFGGLNKMRVSVTVRAPDGAVLRTFEVTRKINPLAFGAYFDPRHNLVWATADGVVDAIRHPGSHVRPAQVAANGR